MTLLMRDQENVEKGIEIGTEKGIEIGIKIGIEKGIMATISALRDFGVEDNVIVQKIQEEFKISEEETKKYL